MKNQRGFSLIELAIVLAIVGLMAIVSLIGYTFDRETAMKKEAGEHAAKVVKAAQEYVGKYAGVLTNQQGIAQVCKRSLSVAAGGDGETIYLRKVPRLVPGQTTNVDPYRQAGTSAITSANCDAIEQSQTIAPLPDLSKQCGAGRCAFFNDAVAELVDAGILDPGFERTNPRSNDRYWMEIRVTGVGTDARVEVLVSTFINAIEKASGPAAAQAAVSLVKDADLGVVRVAGQSVDGQPFDDTPGPGMPAVTLGQLYAFGKPTDAGNGWALSGSDWSSIIPPDPSRGQLVGRVSVPAADPHVRTDGGNKMGNNLNIGGNTVLNFKKVKIGDPCDADPGKAELLVGATATVDPLFVDTTNPLSSLNPNKRLGAGYSAICGYDQLSKSFIWKTSSPTGTVEDTQAGLYEGRESIAKLACWGTTAGENAQGVWNAGGTNFVKFVIKNGDVWGYAAIVSGTTVTGWLNVTRTSGVPNSGPGTGPGGGYDLNYDWSSFNAGFGTFPVLFYDAAAGFVCRQPYNQSTGTGDRNLAATTSWEMGSQLVSFNSQFTYYVPAVQGGSGQGAETLAGIPIQYNVPTYSISCNGLGSCSLVQGTQVYTATTSARTNADGSTGSWTAISAPGSTIIWPLIKKTRCNLGPPGSPPPMICPA